MPVPLHTLRSAPPRPTARPACAQRASARRASAQRASARPARTHRARARRAALARASLVALLAAPLLAACHPFERHTVELYPSDFEVETTRAFLWPIGRDGTWQLAVQVDAYDRLLLDADLDPPAWQALSAKLDAIHTFTPPAPPALVAELAPLCDSVTVLLAQHAASEERGAAERVLDAWVAIEPAIDTHVLVLPFPMGPIADREALQARLAELRDEVPVERAPERRHAFGLAVAASAYRALFHEETVTLLVPLAVDPPLLARVRAPLLAMDDERELVDLPVETLDAASALADLRVPPSALPADARLVLLVLPRDAPPAARELGAMVLAGLDTPELAAVRLMRWPAPVPFEALDGPAAVRELVVAPIAREIAAWTAAAAKE